MMKSFAHLSRVLFIAAYVALGCSSIFAQPQNTPASKSQVSTSCDGALDIVPSKAVTFARKRRPTTTGKPAPATAKPDKKQAGEEKPGR